MNLHASAITSAPIPHQQPIFSGVSPMTNLPLNYNMPNKIVEIWANILNSWGRAWWIEVFTAQPKCTYYFGPFAHMEEAQGAIQDYIEDLESEAAQGIQAEIKRCKPVELTIDHDLGAAS
jgi:Domain of unknown function (DUF1816)